MLLFDIVEKRRQAQEGIMDPNNHIQQLRKSLKEWEEKATKVRAECEEDLKIKLQLHRSDAEIKKRQEHQQIDKYIIYQRNLLDKALTIEQDGISVAMKVSLRDMMTKALDDQRAAFDKKMKQERTVLNEALSKALEQTDDNIHSDRAKVDSLIKEAWEQMDKDLENERSNLKSLIESLIEKEELRATLDDVRASVEEELHANNNEQVQADGINIPKRCLFILMDNECDQDVVMKFKVHIVKELYSDLKKYYDSRENLGQFTITKPATNLKFFKIEGALRPFGYIGAAELYYLNPVPGSEPSTRLIKINGQAEVNELELAHAAERTKICHLYLVGPEEVLDDDMWYYDDEE